MQRYFIKLSYKGTNFSGWQRQANAHTVQEEIEDAIQLLLRDKINIIGCGRTDSGVHASNYIAHFDLNQELDVDLVFKLNHVISKDIIIHGISPVDQSRHSRFDATLRSYEYTIKGVVDPFDHELAFYYPLIHKLDVDMLNTAASMLLEYDDFFTFCKAKTDVRTTLCDIKESHWHWTSDNTLKYNISANRFLRGMVRLIVGMCMNLSLNKLNIEEVRTAIEEKKRLHRDWSVAAQGLILKNIEYPYDLDFEDSVFNVEEGSLSDVSAMDTQFRNIDEDHIVNDPVGNLDHINHKVFTIKKDHKLIAVVLGILDSDKCRLQYLVVHKAFRRIGLATDLLNQITDWAKSKGCIELFLNATMSDKVLRSFLINRHFVIDESIAQNKLRRDHLLWYRRIN